MMRRLKRRLTHQLTQVLPRRAEGTDRGHLHRGIVVEGRQDARQTLRQHGFTRTGRASQQHVVATRSGNFQGETTLRLTGDIAHIRGNFSRFRHRGARLRLRGGRVGQLLGLRAESGKNLRQAAETTHLRAGNERRLLSIFGGHNHAVVSGIHGCFDRRQDARHGAYRSVQSQLAQEDAIAAGVQFLLRLQRRNHNG